MFFRYNSPSPGLQCQVHPGSRVLDSLCNRSLSLSLQAEAMGVVNDIIPYLPQLLCLKTWRFSKCLLRKIVSDHLNFSAAVLELALKT